MTQFTAGAARHDITIFDRDAEMMGWAQPSNKARGVATPLHARAFVIRDQASGRKMVFVNVELCFVSDSIRRSVLARIADIDGVSPERVMMMATHTHSGPGGYSYDLVYTMTTPGFRPRILEAIVSGVVTAIREADAARVPARLRLHRRPVPLSAPADQAHRRRNQGGGSNSPTFGGASVGSCISGAIPRAIHPDLGGGVGGDSCPRPPGGTAHRQRNRTARCMVDAADGHRGRGGSS
jgi:hypothetical protein